MRRCIRSERLLRCHDCGWRGWANTDMVSTWAVASDFTVRDLDIDLMDAAFDRESSGGHPSGR
jgi:hypothetical protein